MIVLPLFPRPESIRRLIYTSAYTIAVLLVSAIPVDGQNTGADRRATDRIHLTQAAGAGAADPYVAPPVLLPRLVVTGVPRHRIDGLGAPHADPLRRQPRALAGVGLLGNTLKQQGRTLEALDLYRTAARTHPDDPRVWLEIGLLEHVHGRHAEAIQAFRTAERLDPRVFRRVTIQALMFEASHAGRLYDGN